MAGAFSCPPMPLSVHNDNGESSPRTLYHFYRITAYSYCVFAYLCYTNLDLHTKSLPLTTSVPFKAIYGPEPILPNIALILIGVQTHSQIDNVLISLKKHRTKHDLLSIEACTFICV